MKNLFLPLLLSSLLCTTLQWADAPSFPPPEGNEELIVYNRILAKVNGKTLSVIDVMKKMDVFLQKNYPHLVNSKVARYQFYSSQWRPTLMAIIHEQLMLADAEHLELKITDGEVREEMLQRFGPSIMATLDKLGLTYDEAREMIYSEIAVQRMMWFRVNSKALNKVNPQDIRQAYKQFCQEHPSLEKWEYQVLSLRSANRDIGESIAAKAFELLHAAKGDFQSVTEQMKSETSDVTVTLSNDLEADENSIAESHKAVLKTLEPGSFSPPIAQVSRVDNSMVQRIFYLKSRSRQEVPHFQELAEKLKDELLEEAIEKESSQYTTKLRERLGFDEQHMLETLPDDFRPFVLR